MTRRLLATIDAGEHDCENCVHYGPAPSEVASAWQCGLFIQSWLRKKPLPLSSDGEYPRRLPECLAADQGEVEP